MESISFSKAELERYSRHLAIPEFNIEGQKKLKAAKVLAVGAGGLGAPLLQYLTAAGVGTIGILDCDAVEESNLQRQVLFSTADLGKPKVTAAREALQALNPHVIFTLHHTRLTSQNAMDIFGEYDIIADGTDNFPTRYLVNDACVLLNKTNVFASVYRFEGQVSVFNHAGTDGRRGPNYRDLFPTPPPPGAVPSCAEAGVLGVLPGILGSLQANETLKVITGIGEPLSGKLFLINALTLETRLLSIQKDDSNPLTGKNPTLRTLIDYEEFCGGAPQSTPPEPVAVKEISPSELEQLISTGADFQLIDVREPYEYDIVNLGGELMPLKKIEEHVAGISATKKVVVHCRSGKRSAEAIRLLQEKFGLKNLYNLRGGILAYTDEVDPGMVKY